MKKIIIYLLTAFIVLSIFSCKKNNDSASSASSLVGNWKFISISAQTQSTASYTDPSDGTNYVTITNSKYTSTNNAGTVAFTSSNITGTGITYQINDTAYGYDYVDNQLDDSLSSPFTFSYPATNSNSSYNIIGQDSIYFAGQSFIATQAVSGNTSPSGAKFTISGNTLTMTSNIVKDTVINYSGLLFQNHETALASVILQKQ